MFLNILSSLSSRSLIMKKKLLREKSSGSGSTQTSFLHSYIRNVSKSSKWMKEMQGHPLIASTVHVLEHPVRMSRYFMYTVMIQVVDYGEKALIHRRDSKCLSRSVTFQVSRSTREYFYTRLIVILFSVLIYRRIYFFLLTAIYVQTSLRKRI